MSEALNEIKDLSYLSVDPASSGEHFSESAHNILVEWLQSFSLQSEDAFYEVVQYLEDAYTKQPINTQMQNIYLARRVSH